MLPRGTLPTTITGDLSLSNPPDGCSPASPLSTWQHPPSFYCPISQQCMRDPVVLSDGHTYERRHIERWLQQHSTSPVSGVQLTQKDIFSNHALRNAIEEYFQQVFSGHRRAIRKTISGPTTQESLGSNVPLLRTIDSLMQCSLLVNAELNTECVLQQIMGEAKMLVGAEVASVFLLDATRQELYSTVNSTGGEIRIFVTVGIAGHVATTGEPVIIHDAYSDSRFNKAIDAKTGFKTRNIMCVPLKVKKGGVIGVVQLINKTGTGVLATDGQHNDRFGCSAPLGAIAEETDVGQTDFTPDDLQFLQVFASQAATAITSSACCDFAEQNPQSDSMNNTFWCKCCFGRPPKDVSEIEAIPKTLNHVPEVTPSALEENTEGTVASSVSPMMELLEKSSDDDPAAIAQASPARRALVSPVNDYHLSRPSNSYSSTDTSTDKVAEMLAKAFEDWQFDALALMQITNNKPLSTLGCYLFERHGFVERFGMDYGRLSHFFSELEQGYDDANSYHNRTHAASVLQLMHAMVAHGGIAKSAALAFRGGNDPTEGDAPLESMACLFAAAVHDYEHWGLSNDFLVRTLNERALYYNDWHTNEQHHVAAAFKLLQRPECNFLASMESTTFHRFRTLVIDLVLGTDMADNNRILKSFTEALDEWDRSKTDSTSISPSSASGELAAFTPTTANEAALLLQTALKCADLGHLTLEWGNHVEWVQRLEREYFAQGDREKALGLNPISFLMDRDKEGVSETQAGFFDFIVFPLFSTLVRAAPLVEPMLRGVTANYQQWLNLKSK